MGIVLVAFLAAWIGAVPSCYHDDINLETHQLGRKLRVPIALPLRISVLDGNVLSFDVAQLAQSQPNSLGPGWTQLAGEDDDRYPIRGTFFGCCADAESQSAKSKALRVRTVHFSLHDFSCSSTYHSTLAPWEIKIGLFIFVGSRAMILFHVGL